MSPVATGSTFYSLRYCETTFLAVKTDSFDKLAYILLQSVPKLVKTHKHQISAPFTSCTHSHLSLCPSNRLFLLRDCPFLQAFSTFDFSSSPRQVRIA